MRRERPEGQPHWYFEYEVAREAYEAGLDVDRMSIYGLNPFWYRQFVLDDDGNRMVVADEFVWRAVPFPSPRVGLWIWWLWLHDGRRRL